MDALIRATTTLAGAHEARWRRTASLGWLSSLPRHDDCLRGNPDTCERDLYSCAAEGKVLVVLTDPPDPLV